MYILLIAPLIAFLCVLAVLFFLFRRRWSAVVLLTAALLLNWWSESIALHPHFSDPLAETRGDQTIRLLTYNICSPGLYMRSQRDLPDGCREIRDMVKANDPDIVFFPEYSYGQCRALADSLYPKYPYTSWNMDDGFLWKGADPYVFSRFPISNVRRFEVPHDTMHYQPLERREDVWSRIWSMELKVKNRKVKLIYCHLKSNDYSLARKKVVEDPSKNHWADGIEDYYGGIELGYKLRAMQAQIICDSIRSWGDVPILVVGDYNDIGGSYVVRSMEHCGMQDAWWKTGFGFGFTYDAYHLLLRLDHILCSRHFTPRAAGVITDISCSDHYPLVADLDFNLE